MNKKIFVFIFLVGILFISGCSGNVNGNAVKEGRDVTVYKSQSCGCCGIYTNYLKGKGNFNVNVVDMMDLSPLKRELEVPFNLESCHTTKVGDYFVEGHAPLEAVNKLIAEKPDILGIALPGMPQGSPGMPGSKNGEFVIYSVNKDGSQDIFMRL